jgi:hypothetical protein
MVAYEHFKKFTYKEIVLGVIFALFSSLILFLSVSFSNPYVAIIISLASGVIFMNLFVYLTQKSGSALLFYFLLGLFTINIDDLGISGWEKVGAYVFAGLIFEIIFLVLKFTIYNLPVDMILGTSFSTASIVLFSSILIVFGFPSLSLKLTNLIIIAFFTGLFFSTFTFLIWYFISGQKWMIKFRNYLGY